MSNERLRIPPPASEALTANADYIENLYTRWQASPSAVAADWQAFFRGFDLARQTGEGGDAVESRAQSQVASLIYAYRSIGHSIANTDPLGDPIAS